MDLQTFLNNSFLSIKKEDFGTIVGPDPDAFRNLHKLAFSRDMPTCWRATWLMDYLSELHPWLAEDYIDKTWAEIPKEHPVGVTRSALRMLCRYEVPEEHQGIATDLCLDWLTQEAIPVAIKAYSMEVILKIAREYPELSDEFITILEEQAPNNSAGFKARAKHIIKELHKL